MLQRLFSILCSLLLLTSTFTPTVYAEKCLELPEEVDEFGATYTSTSEAEQTTWDLWLSKERITYSYPDRQLADIWYRISVQPKERIAKERWFLKHKRFVEYEPVDLETTRQALSWQRLRTLHLPEALTDHPNAVRYRCLDAERHTFEDGNVLVNATYLPALNLIAELTVRRTIDARLVRHEQLQDIRPRKASQAFYAKRDALAGLDFADIGDNEADPFVKAGIASGLIEHDEHGH